VIVSGAWGILLFWRARYESRAIWKSIVFSSGGLVLVWTLLATLGMPWLDHTRNYASMGKSLSQVIPSKVSCVRAVDLSESARGAIYYYARVPFVANDATFDNVTCPYIITHERNLKASDRVMIDQTITFDQRDWQIVWIGERIAERENLLVLLRQK
jgi:4-amino-4-deoxy-L-arabinose transferase-like glycosyltransferase